MKNYEFKLIYFIIAIVVTCVFGEYRISLRESLVPIVLQTCSVPDVYLEYPVDALCHINNWESEKSSLGQSQIGIARSYGKLPISTVIRVAEQNRD